MICVLTGGTGGATHTGGVGGGAESGAVPRATPVRESPRGAATTLRVGARSRARLRAGVARLLSATGAVMDALGADAASWARSVAITSGGIG